jgi:predicted 3-demethylubiquinone-9 3-methyltransferase (glyoxalase superfamily)
MQKITPFLWFDNNAEWKIVPKVLIEMLSDKDAKKSQKVMQAMLQMKIIVIDDLKKAYNN